MENFEKCTVAMLGGPCSQHVTGNTSWQNQPQSAIMNYKLWVRHICYVFTAISKTAEVENQQHYGPYHF